MNEVLPPFQLLNTITLDGEAVQVPRFNTEFVDIDAVERLIGPSTLVMKSYFNNPQGGAYEMSGYDDETFFQVSLTAMRFFRFA